MERVLIISGSESDKAIVDKVADALKEFGVECRAEVASAHRMPEKLEKLISASGASVFIAVAGLSAALPGVIASKTTKPVIGVPVNIKLDGLDALLSMMQMPPGVPVATVGVDNAKNAAILAVQILALNDKTLDSKLKEIRAKWKK
ncbi:MAG: 5-(carboxyamino)imidazole ribonucleotide mutase [Candidatus Micrarchaeota archaeon]